ncbi:metalloregulator ArsR/SmtB family transcription factor [Sphingomonas sp.]|uniref:ArsR/SmtB family transcription factor n=1 Tax=Sphingomonas sp. TaxID=28214 RepID=UPI00258B9192|nr:metalloregulator ArsR/SmtB family transcription factor [Sphingomonas sp.]
MDKMAAIQLMSALAQPTRMEVFFALRDRAGGLSVGELANLVDTPPNTMSSHLSILARAGAVIAARSGRVVTYSAHPGAVSELASFLSGGGQSG